ncbi:hypothetical protein DY000_02048602 [Brassica cretica]|uniref:Uncharacterized protein n=1 Tax=Brassica cretica TaxID=69181 RepID=A0ABQ7ETR9_BRACR|nr:hypothetical protein DY000_02048602 [Brassica cretica]
MKVEVGKRNGLVTYMEVDEDEQMSLSSRDSGPFIDLGIRGSQSGFGLVQSGFGFSGLSKSVPFGLYENSVRDRFGFYRVRVGLVNSSKNRYNPMYFRVRVPIGSSV